MLLYVCNRLNMTSSLQARTVTFCIYKPFCVQTYPLEFIDLPKKNYFTNCVVNSIPVATRFKALFCGRSLAGIAGSNLTMGVDVCLLLVLFVVS